MAEAYSSDSKTVFPHAQAFCPRAHEAKGLQPMSLKTPSVYIDAMLGGRRFYYPRSPVTIAALKIAILILSTSQFAWKTCCRTSRALWLPYNPSSPARSYGSDSSPKHRSGEPGIKIAHHRTAPQLGTSSRTTGEVGGSTQAHQKSQYLCGNSHFHLSLEFPRKPLVNDLSTSRSAKQRALGSTCNHCLCVHPPAACDSTAEQSGLEVCDPLARNRDRSLSDRFQSFLGCAPWRSMRLSTGCRHPMACSIG